MMANGPEQKRDRQGDQLANATGTPTADDPAHTSSPPPRKKARKESITAGSTYTAAVAVNGGGSSTPGSNGATGAGINSDTQSSRKGKSCSSCRRLKVKCDLAEKGLSSCSRCVRLGIQCLSEKKTWTSVERGDRPSDTDMTIVKLERAMRDVLEKLGLPELELYARPAIVDTFVSPGGSGGSGAVVRPKSPDPTTNGADISPGPMNSLIEATRIEGLRSRLRSVKQRRRGGMRRMDADLVSENLITLAEAEEMLAVFHTQLSHHLFSARVKADASLDQIRTSSTVLFTAIIMVSALHIPGQERLHKACHSRFLGLISSAIFDPFHTLDDIRGLCIAAFWQPDLTWKLSGIAIRMATELNLHHAFHEAFHTPDLSAETRKDCMEKARIWYFLYLLDHTSSIAYGRPPVMTELRPIKDYDALLRSSHSTAADRELLAVVSGCAIISRAFEMFGLEPKRAMAGDDAHVLNHLRFVEDLHSWRDKWTHLAEPPADPLDQDQDAVAAARHNLTRGVELHYHFSQLVLNALVLRGRELDQLQNLPTALRPLALRAIEAAHAILQHFMVGGGSNGGTNGSANRSSSNPPQPASTAGEERDPSDALVGMPLYLHSMIAFAVVFLMRLSSRWHTIGISISPVERTRPLIEGIITLLRGCKAGKAHMVFSMANGFERMLKQMDAGASAGAKGGEQYAAAAAALGESGFAAAAALGNLASSGSLGSMHARGVNGHMPSSSRAEISLPRQASANVLSSPLHQHGLSSQQQYMQQQQQQHAQQTHHHLQHPQDFSPSDSTDNTTAAAGLLPHDVSSLYAAAAAANSNTFSGATGLGFAEFPYGSWGFQDEELWSLGLGYDLLAPSGGNHGGQAGSGGFSYVPSGEEGAEFAGAARREYGG